MKMVLADLELDLNEIKLLMGDLSHQPDLALVEVSRERIKSMQSHLDQLLQIVDNLQLQSVSTEKTLKDSTPLEDKVTDKEEDIIVTLAQQIKPAKDLKGAFSLNDTFRFSRELFGGDTGYMNQVLDQMSQMENHQYVSSFLVSKVKLIDPEQDEVLIEFQEIIKKYFT